MPSARAPVCAYRLGMSGSDTQTLTYLARESGGAATNRLNALALAQAGVTPRFPHMLDNDLFELAGDMAISTS